MTPLSVPLSQGRAAFLAQTGRFLAVTSSLDDRELMSASWCHGWAVLDVVVHVRLGLEEMLRGVVAPTDLPGTVDAATYWSNFAASIDPGSSVDGILWTRRVASAYRSPAGAVRHLADTAQAILGAADQLTDQPLRFQGGVLNVGDFLATWAVELAVHHVDIGRELDVGEPTPDALHLTRATVGALLGTPAPDTMSDLEVLMVGSGRSPVPAAHPDLRAVLG